MAITEEEVKHVAWLSRLELSKEELAGFARQLDQILGHFEHLQELETEDAPPTSHPLPMTNVLRADKVTDSLSREDVLTNAPERDEEYFIVPRIVGE